MATLATTHMNPHCYAWLCLVVAQHFGAYLQLTVLGDDGHNGDVADGCPEGDNRGARGRYAERPRGEANHAEEETVGEGAALTPKVGF